VAVTLDAFIRGYIAQRNDLKPATATVLEQCRIWLVRFLGEDRRLDTVTSADADAYKAHMIETGLAKATIAKRLRYARHYFGVAIRRGLVKANPFGHLSVQVKGDPSRRVLIPGDVVKKVMDVVPDPQWTLLIALARWGGLRIPSEALALTWRDVDFAGRRFIVRSPKTEHHADGGIRMVPMFPELAALFQAVFDAAEDGAVYVIARYCDPTQNLRTQLRRYAAHTGVVLPCKPWQNCRVSRATEMADQFPSHVCAAWLGHTEKIADAFYRQVTDDHFAKAIGGKAPGKALDGHGANGDDGDGQGVHNPGDGTAHSAAQNPAQQVPETARNGSQRDLMGSEEPLNLQGFATPC
jgi:integrase